ncbi:AbrB/MazE/SpoVT family DNA-binding domain-containing protein [Candidatus Daviesbacteria bacterium]|nr:AbrB/MazE/SpoVT family DNA-binding domain-containing protein [Candidatus Daviesbacteria bacterium]
MNQLATITSKKQLTLPAELFRKAGLRIGQKVIVSEENGRLVLTPAERLVEELAGSVPMPKRWKGASIDRIVEQAKDEYFKEKYRLK